MIERSLRSTMSDIISDEDKERACIALRELVNQNHIKHYLVGVREDPDLQSEIRERSYVHPLGIVKIPILVDVHNQWELRLHYWHKDNQHIRKIDNDIHNHKWDFVSTIVMGRIVHTLYAEVADGDEFYVQELGTSGIGSKRRYSEPKKIKMAPAYTTHYLKGSSYFISRHVAHSVKPTGGDAITLMLRGKYSANSTNIYWKQKASQQEFSGLPEVLSSKQLAEILDKAIENI